MPSLYRGLSVCTGLSSYWGSLLLEDLSVQAYVTD